MVNTTANVLVQPLNAKTTGRSDMEIMPPTMKYSKSSGMADKSGDILLIHQKQEVQQPVSNNMVEISGSVQAWTPESEEAAAVMTVPLQPADGMTKSESEHSLCSDQSLEGLIDGNMVRDEWSESLPGFDVLADEKTEDMAYEDNPKYLRSLNWKGDREDIIMQHSCDQNDHDERVFLRNGQDPSEHLDGEDWAYLGKYSAGRALGRKVGRAFFP